MRLTEFVVVVMAALLFLIPTMRNENRQFERQEQEEAPIERNLEDNYTFRVTFEVTRPEEEAIADIIWMKKAAEIAQDEGIPYFNVLEQHTTSRFVKSAGLELSVIDGVIQLDRDPMRAEFDANEIESLVLTESP